MSKFNLEHFQSNWIAGIHRTARGSFAEHARSGGRVNAIRLEMLRGHNIRKSRQAVVAAWDWQLNQPLRETYEDEDAWVTTLGGQHRFLLDVINDTGAPVTGGAIDRLNDLKVEWSQRKNELRDNNALDHAHRLLGGRKRCAACGLTKVMKDGQS